MNFTEILTSAALGTLNRGGRILQQVGCRTPDLSLEGLMGLARHRARLENFGSWPIREPLERLLNAYDREADLTMLGRITVRELLVNLLEGLLYLEQERQSSPDIEQQTIDAPVYPMAESGASSMSTSGGNGNQCPNP